uniref:Ovule protein n=1 Tax=Ascaris lumbricoides TaxID=6252 RepID=A0A0M3HNT5_ASCLU
MVFIEECQFGIEQIKTLSYQFTLFSAALFECLVSPCAIVIFLNDPLQFSFMASLDPFCADSFNSDDVIRCSGSSILLSDSKYCCERRKDSWRKVQRFLANVRV